MLTSSQYKDPCNTVSFVTLYTTLLGCAKQTKGRNNKDIKILWNFM